ARITAAALGLPIEVLEEPDCKPFKARGAAAAPEADDNFYRESLVRTLQHLSGFGRVALNGQGSDEVFYRELLVDEAKRSPGWQLALDAARTWYVTGRRPPIGLRAGARRDGPRLSAAQAPKWPNWIEPAWALRLDLAGRLAILAAPVREAKTTPHAAARTRLRSPFWAPYVERYDAGFSGAAIETRWPFLDARIIRFALSLPPFPWSVEKHVLRRALQPLLPAPVARRPKTRLQGEPFSAYLGADPAWPDKAMEQVMSLEGYVRPSRWRGLLESQTTLPLESAWSLGRPVALSLWLNSQPATAHETALRA
ncbi:MAG: asparagine synthase-related protein, partial [Woeseiaceae bacterium]